MNFKCHWCHKTLEHVDIYENGLVRDRKKYECPDMHIAIIVRDNCKIIEYYCFFYKNDAGDIRYKMSYYGNCAALYRRNLTSSSRAKGYQHLITIPNPPELELSEDGFPQVERLFNKLKKLVIFT